MKKKFFGILTLVALYFVILYLGYGKLPGKNIFYTPDFSYKNFQQIKIGMTMDQVKKVLGEPYSILLNDSGDTWNYSTTGKKGEFEGGSWINTDNFFGIRAIGVFFNKDQKVAGKIDHILNIFPFPSLLHFNYK